MVTNEISIGAALVQQAATPAVDEGGELPLAEKFSRVLHALLGGSLQAMLGGVADMGMVSVSAAAPQAPKEVNEEVPVKEDTVDETDDGREEVRRSLDDTDHKEVEQGGEEVAVVQQAPVQAVGEMISDEQVEEVLPGAMQEVATTERKGDPKGGENIPAFQIQKLEVATENPQREMNKDAGGQVSGQAVQAVTDVQSAKGDAGKSTAAQKGATAASESYYAIQRALETADDGIKPDAAPQQGAATIAPPVKSAAQAAIPSGAAETALAQAMAARLAASAEQNGAQGPVKGREGSNAVTAAWLGNQATAEKFSIAKAKPAAGLPPKDQQKVVEQVKEMLQKAIQNRDGNTLTVRLNPPELGWMTVKVTQRESQVYARIIPESPQVEQALRQRAGEVTQVLVAAGLKPDQVLVSVGRERTDAEAFQFKENMSQPDNGARHEGREGSGGSNEEDMWSTGMSNQADDVMAESGWVA